MIEKWSSFWLVLIIYFCVESSGWGGVVEDLRRTNEIVNLEEERVIY